MDDGKRSYDKPPTIQTEGPTKVDQPGSDVMPPQQFIPAQTQPPDPAGLAAVPPPPEEAGQARDHEPPRDESQTESDLMPPQQFIPTQSQPPAPDGLAVPEPMTQPTPPEPSQEQVTAPIPGPTGVVREEPVSVADPAPPSDQFSRRATDDVRERNQEPMSHALKVAYGVVCGVLALSALGVLFVRLHHSDGAHPTRASAPTTTTTSMPAKDPNTVVLPSRLSPSAEVAADDLVTSWSMNNRLGALAVATPSAATTIFQRDLRQWNGHQSRVQHVLLTDCLHVWATRRCVADRSDLSDQGFPGCGWLVRQLRKN